MNNTFKIITLLSTFLYIPLSAMEHNNSTIAPFFTMPNEVRFKVFEHLIETPQNDAQKTEDLEENKNFKPISPFKASFNNFYQLGRTNKNNWSFLWSSSNLLKLVIKRCSFTAFLKDGLWFKPYTKDPSQEMITTSSLISHFLCHSYEKDPAAFFSKVISVSDLHSCHEEKANTTTEIEKPHVEKLHLLTYLLYGEIYDEKNCLVLGDFFSSPNKSIKHCLSQCIKYDCNTRCFLSSFFSEIEKKIFEVYTQRLGSKDELRFNLTKSKYRDFLVKQAIIHNDLNVLTFLHKNKISVTLPYADGHMPVLDAINEGTLETVNFLVDTASMDKEYLEKIQEASASIKISLMNNGQNEQLQLQVNYYLTPLTIACIKNKIEIVNYLLKQGTEKKIPFGTLVGPSDSGFAHAVVAGYLDIAELLLKAGSDINAKVSFNLPTGGRFEQSLLDNIVWKQDTPTKQTNVLKWMIKNGADINAENSWGHTALTTALSTGQLDTVKVLLDHGCRSLGRAFNGEFWSNVINLLLSKKHTSILDYLLTREDFCAWLHLWNQNRETENQ